MRPQIKTCSHKFLLIDHLHETSTRVAALIARLNTPAEDNSTREEILAVQTEWEAICEELRWHRSDHGC